MSQNKINSTRHLEDDGYDRDNDEWYLNDPNYIPPPKLKLIYKDRCVCSSIICREIAKVWREELKFNPILFRVQRHQYREFLFEQLGITKSLRMMDVRISLLHFDMKHRHSAYFVSDAQFHINGLRVSPNLDWTGVREKIRMCSQIQTRDSFYFHNVIRPNLMGEGCATMTMDQITNDPILKKMIITTVVEDFLMATADDMLRSAKLDGSRFFLKFIASRSNRALVQIPKDINEKEFLHYYIIPTRCMLEQSTNDGQQPLKSYVTTRLPHSCRQKHSRPAVQNSPYDVEITSSTDIELLMITLLPINKKPNRGRIDNDVRNRTMINLAINVQGQTLVDYSIMMCNMGLQTVYIDGAGKLPQLSRTHRSAWENAYYYLVREVLSLSEVKKAVNFCTSTNLSYLPVILLMMCRTKAKQNEKSKYKEDTHNTT